MSCISAGTKHSLMVVPIRISWELVQNKNVAHRNNLRSSRKKMVVPPLQMVLLRDLVKSPHTCIWKANLVPRIDVSGSQGILG